MHKMISVTAVTEYLSLSVNSCKLCSKTYGHCVTKRSLSLAGPVRMLQFGSLNLRIMDK